jgi:hypothetical protein
MRSVVVLLLPNIYEAAEPSCWDRSLQITDKLRQRLRGDRRIVSIPRQGLSDSEPLNIVGS